LRILRCIWIGLLLVAVDAHGHKASDSYLTLRAEGDRIGGQWEIALRDLEQAIGLDADGDGAITWGELRSRQGAVDAYAMERLSLLQDGQPCASRLTDRLVDHHSDGAYTVLRFEAQCTPARTIEVAYNLLFEVDPTHRGLLRWETGGRTVTAVLGPDAPRLALTAEPVSGLLQFASYAREGVRHIWIGIDHLLFLLSLLLPAVFAQRGRGWAAVDRFAPALVEVVKVVTAFTVAHSITLSLAALSVVELPSRLTETAIAFSVLLAALNNVWPLVRGRRWMVAFGFGLIHGFGFATVLGELGLPQDALLRALVGFNLGVEAGQLAVVAAFLPLAFGMRRTWFYRRVLLDAGSVLIALLALGWMVERWFDLRLLP